MKNELGNVCFMEIGETSHVHSEFYKNYFDLKQLLDRAITYLNRPIENFRFIQKEKKDLEIKLEVRSVERNLFQEENHELKLQINELQNVLNCSLLNHISRYTGSQFDHSDYFSIENSANKKPFSNSCHYYEKSSHGHFRCKFHF